MKKIISSILAASFIFATCAINVMAAPKDRTLTITATPNAELEVGSEINVKVLMSNNENVFATAYRLNFDANVFELDATDVEYNEDTGDTAPAYIDLAWIKDINKAKLAWKKYLGAVDFSGTDVANGAIQLNWQGNTKTKLGVETTAASDDFVLGNFTFKVKAVPEAGSSSITFDKGVCDVLQYGENTSDSLTLVPCTVNFKQATPPAPVETPWEFTVTTDANAKKTNGYIWDVTGTKGDGDLTSFVATFTNEDETATGEDKTLIKTIDGADLAALSNWNTAPAFAIGLKTDKAVTADFTATSTKDGKTINATIAR